MIKPRRFVNYDKYTMFMSFIAHEVKRYGIEKFIEKYKNSNKYTGIYRKYICGYIEYIENKKNGINISKNSHINKRLIVEPYVYTQYFKFKNKDIIEDALKMAIPEFLNRGLLITEVQEAVNASGKHTLFKE